MKLQNIIKNNQKEQLKNFLKKKYLQLNSQKIPVQMHKD
jgi:hypothetical protein